MTARLEPLEVGRIATPLLSVADIFAPLPPVPWLCEALDIAPGPPALVAGYGFSGKTAAVQDFALAVASAMPAWGRFAVRSGRVLHLDYEQGAHLTRLRYQRLARARGIDPNDLGDRLQLAVMPPWYLDADAPNELPRLAERFDVLIVDSFRAACPHTDENGSEARIPLDRLARISEESGIAAIVVHHARKPSRDAQGGARMTVRGSGALYDACGSVLVFAAEKGDPIAVAHEKARISGRLHPDFRLWIEDVEVDGNPMGGLRISCQEAPSGNAKEAPADRYANLKRRVMALVREAGTVAGGANTLHAKLGGRRANVLAAIAELEAQGLLRRSGGPSNPTITYAGTTE